MKVILKEDVDRLGEAGQIVNVSYGYARNYLIPRKKALEATSPNMAVYKEELRQKEIRETKAKRTAESITRELSKISLTALVTVGEDDRVFGSVTAQDIAELLKEKGYDIDRHKIILDEPIRALGVYAVGLKLHSDVEAKVKLWVVKE